MRQRSIPLLALVLAVTTLSGCHKKAPQSLKACCVRGVARASQVGSTVASPKVLTFSNMYIQEETGDVLGWDIRMRPVASGYDAVIYFGEGAPGNPLRVHLKSLQGVQHVGGAEPFGAPVQLEFVSGGVYVTAGDGERELIPSHKNFLKEEYFK
ncbi:hypothetical protein ACFQBQ_15390 [Granulicella cerasi]|uniref:Lipoprotein n=1 Tax=Granulicella cerasi TaxID=741063 RepID=A0ABW1ZBR7_9BACT|nr:hypothetical protein [Granulicella cerasi]